MTMAAASSLRARPRLLLLSLISTVLAVSVLALLREPFQNYPLLPLSSAPYPAQPQSFQSQLNSSTIPREAAANSTLGFAQLLALSSGPSWRTRGLKAAGDLVGLDFTIPQQVSPTDELVTAFKSIAKDKGKDGPSRGSAKAWIAHLNLLRHVVASNWETAFIIEDDVDFDVEIKQQIRLISDNVRSYTNTLENDASPYGQGWDVLWIGHCGSLITKEIVLNSWAYQDESRCPTEAYAGWAKKYLREFTVPGQRLVQASELMVCTFGYGVTQSAARRIVELGTTDNADEAFDVALSKYCREKKLKCITVNPQVFVHYEPAQKTGYVSQVHDGDGGGKPKEGADYESMMGSTANIVRSARCEALFNSTCIAPPREI